MRAAAPSCTMATVQIHEEMRMVVEQSIGETEKPKCTGGKLPGLRRSQIHTGYAYGSARSNSLSERATSS